MGDPDKWREGNGGGREAPEPAFDLPQKLSTGQEYHVLNRPKIPLLSILHTHAKMIRLLLIIFCSSIVINCGFAFCPAANLARRSGRPNSSLFYVEPKTAGESLTSSSGGQPVAPSIESSNSSPPQQETANGNNAAALRKGIWMPPSKNDAQRRGNVFSIQQPQDLLDFVVEDERPSVGK